MSLKQTVLLFVGSVLGIVSSFMDTTHVPGADFVRGVGAGLVIILSVELILKLLKKKNETIAK